MSADLVHLIRHGEVDNPHQLVYADLPGYGLSPRGFDQATAAADHLSDRDVAAVISSPLLRATQTAQTIAAAHGLRLELVGQLVEWHGGIRWAGVAWDDLDRVFPGELSAYLNSPYDLPFPGESLWECGERVAAAVRAAATALPGGELVVVSHQDPIHAGHLVLTHRQPDDYHAGKPGHAGTVALRPTDGAWEHVGYWEPAQGPIFPPIDE